MSDLPDGAVADLHGLALDAPLYRDPIGPGLLSLALLGVAASGLTSPAWGLAVLAAGALVVFLTRPPPSRVRLTIGPTGVRIVRPILGLTSTQTLAWDELDRAATEGNPPHLVLHRHAVPPVDLDLDLSAHELDALVDWLQQLHTSRVTLPEAPEALARLVGRAGEGPKPR